MAGKIQVITDDDAELVCPECGCDDVELVKDDVVTAGDTSNKKRKIITAIVLALIVIGGGLIWNFCSGNGGCGTVPPTDGSDTTVVVNQDSIAKAREDSIAKAKEDSIAKAREDSIAKAKTAPKPGEEVSKPWESYATFDGTTMTFKKSHVIPGTSRTAKPGDKVQGVWKNGEVNSVRWYHADGSPSEHLTHE